jgi:hypothetical protein
MIFADYMLMLRHLHNLSLSLLKGATKDDDHPLPRASRSRSETFSMSRYPGTMERLPSGIHTVARILLKLHMEHSGKTVRRCQVP